MPFIFALIKEGGGGNAPFFSRHPTAVGGLEKKMNQRRDPMQAILASALILLSAEWIIYRTWRNKEPRICLLYAAGLAVTAAAALLTDDVQLICGTVPICVLIGREWRKLKEEYPSKDAAP